MHSVRVSLAKSKLTILQPPTVSFAKHQLYTNHSPPLPLVYCFSHALQTRTKTCPSTRSRKFFTHTRLWWMSFPHQEHVFTLKIEIIFDNSMTHDTNPHHAKTVETLKKAAKFYLWSRCRDFSIALLKVSCLVIVSVAFLRYKITQKLGLSNKKWQISFIEHNHTLGIVEFCQRPALSCSQSNRLLPW